MVSFCVLSRRNPAYSPAAPTVNPRVSVICGLFNSLRSLFTTRVVCFQQLADSFCKTPGGGGTPAKRLFRISDFQPLFSCLCVGSAFSASQRYHLPSISRPFVFTKIRIPWRATPFFSHPCKSLGGVGVPNLAGCGRTLTRLSQSPSKNAPFNNGRCIDRMAVRSAA
jgi:hypothetical protein